MHSSIIYKNNVSIHTLIKNTSLVKVAKHHLKLQWVIIFLEIVISKITDHHYKYNNNEKYIMRITKMWHGDRKWANAVGKNGAYRLAQRRVATNLHFVKKTLSAKHNKTRSACIILYLYQLERQIFLPLCLKFPLSNLAV